ncbi:MAG: N(1)-aminopropylagmatine ureohydrolase [Deltaproteobacteria bacterium ADurb.Bin151]|nr:agmatinase [Smithella sp.]OQB52204.1 MAG: N(1)-aminopropylagmatine ureohydrolase [Deltaproteobacteria bacterium ADurb.Bin151]HOQ42982.1 agmatinase [Smithellaceae bacterium]HPL68474.1 agmatinase [Smithellaceae bacterium]
MNFGGIYPECSLRNAHFVVVPVPYDLTSTYQPGSRRGPVAIIEASTNMELYDEELKKDTYLAGIHTTLPVEVDARGPKYMVSAVRKKIDRVVHAGKIPVMLGGEHSISLGAVQAVAAKYPELTVLQFDAHADLRDSYQGTPYNHACVARQIVDCCSLVQVGIRSMSREEAEYLPKSRVKSYSADYVFENKNWAQMVCKNLRGDVYVSIDLDVFDPSIMPATGTPEPGGLYWRDVLSLLRLVAGKCNIRGFDVVELAPLPGMVAPDFMAAKLIYRLMGYMTK